MKPQRLVVAVVMGSMAAAPMAAATVLTLALRRRERRDRVLSLLQPYLDEPMATTRRSAWAFLHTAGDGVREVAHYWGEDDAYLDVTARNGFADLLRVMLFFGMVHDLRIAGELDKRLHDLMLEPHRLAWADYTVRIASESGAATATEGLFRWRQG